MFKELAGTLTLSRLAIGGVAGGLGVAVTAYSQAERQSQAYTRAIALSGNAAGTTRSELTAIAHAIDANVGSQARAAESLALLAGSGEVARVNLARGARVIAVRRKAKRAGGTARLGGGMSRVASSTRRCWAGHRGRRGLDHE